MATLPTNFKDDILDTSVNTRRRYRMYENTDGTIELEDVTEYSQVGDEFSAGQINATNTEVNKKFDKNMIVRDLNTINAITKEGYVPDALALKEVNDSLNDCKFIFEVLGYGNQSSYSCSVALSNMGFGVFGNAYRNTYTTPNITGFPRLSATMPQETSGGSIKIDFIGTHNIIVEKNTLGINIPTSFTDSLTLNGWSKNGQIIAHIK